MKETIRVSVVIPVYNAQNYLCQCLDSVCAQTLREIEILCVDDGSTDRSPEILEEYRQRDGRLRVFRQENAGAAMARNAGLDRARGEYLICWDADDFFEPAALEKLYGRAAADQADICVCGVSRFFEDSGEEEAAGGYLKMSRVPAELPFNMQTNYEHILDFTTGSACNKLMRRAFLQTHELRFLPLKNGEDINLVTKALCLAERITVVNERLYHYRVSQSDSLSGRWQENYEDPVRAWIDAADYLRERDLFPERSFANRALSFMLSILVRTRSSWEVFRNMVRILKDGALERIGVTEREEGYYYEPWKAECLHHMLNDSIEEFLYYYLFDTNSRLQQARGHSAKLRAELKAAQKTERALARENENLLNSKEYKLGKSMLFLPRGIQKKLKEQ